jgi:hypothetical protein
VDSQEGLSSMELVKRNESAKSAWKTYIQQQSMLLLAINVFDNLTHSLMELSPS